AQGHSASCVLAGHAPPRHRTRSPTQATRCPTRSEAPSARTATLRSQDGNVVVRPGPGRRGANYVGRRQAAAWSATRSAGAWPARLPPSARRGRGGQAYGCRRLLSPVSPALPTPRGYGGHHGSGDCGSRPSARPSPPPLSADLSVWRGAPGRGSPTAAASYPQEPARGLHLGDGAAGQVSVLPADLSAVGGPPQSRPGPVVGHPDRWFAAAGAAGGTAVRGPGAAQPPANVVARRRDAVAGLCPDRGQSGLSLVSLGFSWPRRRGVRAGGRPCPRRTGRAPGTRRARDHGRRPLQGLPGDRAGPKRPDCPGVLLGACAA